jgi:aldose 1-epimerase
MKILQDYFQKSGKEQNIFLFILENNKGLTVKITNYGAILTSIVVPDKQGKFEDIVLGFDNIEQYQGSHPYFGAVCGRYANRIAKGEFVLDGKKYSIHKNNGNNALHGGLKGFDKAIWTAEQINEGNRVGVKLLYLSPDMEEGYPGNLKTEVTYLLNDINELSINYRATTDKPTVLNLTNHSYFNLNSCSTPILNHILFLNSEKITEVNNETIPTGKIVNIIGTAFDFTKPKSIGNDINKISSGYDHNYVINKPPEQMKIAAKVIEPDSGRTMEIHTTAPGVQFYTANYLDGTIKGKNGITYQKHFAFCLEAQNFPDAPNHENFPTPVLRPGQEYSQTTIYKFNIE